MNKAYKRWTLGVLAGILGLLLACAAFVWVVDPCFYYRYPAKLQPVFFNERYQDAGLAKNTDADTVLLGTSMVANYRVSQVEAAFGGTAVKLTIPDGYLSEFDAAMGVVWRYHNPSRVIFGLDTNILVRDESKETDTMPNYLYDANPLNDIKYLLNKDSLYYSLYQIKSNTWGTAGTLDDAYTWDDGIWWNHITALDNYKRPEVSKENLPEDAYLDDTEANLRVVEKWITEHPDTEFDLFFPPYSILYWDKEQRLGETDAVFAALSYAFDSLLRYDNVNLYYFPADQEIVTDLDNYCDYVHHSGKVCTEILSLLQTDAYRVTPENQEKTLDDWRTFVVNYDYDQFWSDAYWEQWNATHS